MTIQEAKDEVRKGLRPEIQLIWDAQPDSVQNDFGNRMNCFRDDSACMEFTQYAIKGSN
jgi:hypothetical protein